MKFFWSLWKWNNYREKEQYHKIPKKIMNVLNMSNQKN
jgi:hypothetical protein